MRRGAEERRAFVLEHTRLACVPLVPELGVYTARAVNPLWFETARWLDDDNAAAPFWCVPWAGGQALARYLLDHPVTVRGMHVLDFACGGGVVGDPLHDVAVVVAGDVWYERAPEARFRRWFDRLARRGVTVLTSDAGRGYAPRRARELARYEVPTPFDLESTPVRTTRVLAVEP